MLRLAVIGLGRRASHMIKAIVEREPDLKIAGVSDPDPTYVRSVLDEVKIDHRAIEFFDHEDQLLERANAYDGLLIGTRCHLHTPMAIKFAGTGLPLFLEKPVAITDEQVHALYNAYCGQEDQVVVSFPLRVTPLFQAVHNIVQSGRLGTINQVQAINNVGYGGVYFGQWYRNYDEVGGLWLQKSTHDFDYINLLLNQTPHAITAVSARRIYSGDMPFDLKCSQCDRTAACMESPQNLKAREDGGGMPMDDHWCAFSKDIRNQDAGSAILIYNDGLHASYSQNFITRRGAHRRGAILTGYKATLEFDWPSNSITIHDHHTSRIDRISVKPTGGHEGGDDELVRGFVQLMRGERASGYADLRDGLFSAVMCLAARESALHRTFQAITPPWVPSEPSVPGADGENIPLPTAQYVGV